MGNDNIVRGVPLRYTSMPPKGDEEQCSIVLTLALINVLCREGFMFQLNG